MQPNCSGTIKRTHTTRPNAHYTRIIQLSSKTDTICGQVYEIMLRTNQVFRYETIVSDTIDTGEYGGLFFFSRQPFSAQFN